MVKQLHPIIWCDVTHPCTNFNGGLTKPPLKLVHGWVITSLVLSWCNDSSMLCDQCWCNLVKRPKGHGVMKGHYLSSSCWLWTRYPASPTSHTMLDNSKSESTQFPAAISLSDLNHVYISMVITLHNFGVDRRTPLSSIETSRTSSWP